MAKRYPLSGSRRRERREGMKEGFVEEMVQAFRSEVERMVGGNEGVGEEGSRGGISDGGGRDERPVASDSSAPVARSGPSGGQRI